MFPEFIPWLVWQVFGRNRGALQMRGSAPFLGDGEEDAKITQNMELLAISNELIPQYIY